MDKKEIIDFFDKCSEFWDANMITDDNKMNMIMDAAGIKQGVEVLDIACGTGVMMNYYLGRDVSHVTGVDISSEMIKIAKEKFSGNDKIDLICGDADTITFNEKYDCCMIFNAFPHFIDPEKLIANLRKSIKDGGFLTIAHDRGRASLDLHHKGKASKVSCGLMSEDILEKIFIKYKFSNIFKKADDEIYIVSGVKTKTEEKL